MILKAFSSKIEKYAHRTPDFGNSKANFMVNMLIRKVKWIKDRSMESSESFIKSLDRM